METPTYKVGIVLLRSDGRVFLLRPHPKNPGERTKFVLPRGSRQYQDTTGQWHDARDEATALAHAESLEPLTRTLAREAEEEAGLPEALLQQLQERGAVRDMGVRLFASASKSPYPIHWFVARLTDADCAQLTPPADALEVRWANLDEIHKLISAGDFSTGYLPVIEEGLLWNGKSHPA